MDQIRAGIIKGAYAPGSYLREQSLESEYGCSRGPIREALRLLEQRGLVTHEPRRGFRVLQLDAQSIRQLYTLRGVLERHAIEGLDGKVTPALLEDLAKVNTVMRRQLQAGRVNLYLQANLDFHAVILRYAPNPVLERVINGINEVGEPLRHAMLKGKRPSPRAVDEHDMLIALLKKGKVSEAAELMQQHILRSIPTALTTLADVEQNGGDAPKRAVK
jgi:DNA-binding GntR family transcriptional regulator